MKMYRLRLENLVDADGDISPYYVLDKVNDIIDEYNLLLDRIDSLEKRLSRAEGITNMHIPLI